MLAEPVPPASPSSVPPASPSGRWDFEAIGTRWLIDTPRPLPEALAGRVRQVIDDFDHTWSRFRSDSVVHHIAAHPGSYRFTGSDAALLDLYQLLGRATAGAVSPLLGRTLEHLGYDADYRLTPLPGPPPLPDPQLPLDWDGTTLTTRGDALLDVGAAGKGLLVDLVGDVLADAAVTEFLIDAGGDLLHRGGAPVRVALEHPADPRQAIGVVELADGAICASAGNRRAWGAGLHHILDAATGEPTRETVATWAMADTAMLADGLATALFFSDGTTLRRAVDLLHGAPLPFHHVRVSATGRADHDSELPGELFR